MSFIDKYQEGDSYSEAPNPTKAKFFTDLVRVATDTIKDHAGADCEASLPELIGLIQSLVSEGEPIDDRKGKTELMIGILCSLPTTSGTRAQLINKLIDTLWNNLQHRLLSYIGGDVKYLTANGETFAIDAEHDKYDTIEFEAVM